MTKDLNAAKIELNGIVQGVGFRPFVYQIALHWGLCGEVVNTDTGVSIHVEGAAENISAFYRDLTRKAPPLARIVEISMGPAEVAGAGGFSIGQSRRQRSPSTLISPDVAVCDDCLRELFDPGDRRFRYPFINCTNCGPRYTIIENIPYDRPDTAMKHFKMCPVCQGEYDDPASRRFHAQPNACSVCGPRMTLWDKTGRALDGGDPVVRAAALLKAGRILAVKGLGGFHLAADATCEAAVQALRQRKRREEKPLAVMVRDLAGVRRLARVDPAEEALLTSLQRPIVLLEKLQPEPLAPSVAPDNRYLGVMLPYTPLHYLLLEEGFTALVMTSGNLSEEPIAIDNEEAMARLGGIADYFLLHNRDIYLRSDDSIVRHAARGTRLVRRSRGYVPVPVFLKDEVPRILACGAELKNTICLTKGRQAFLSQHIGDLENLATEDFLRLTAEHMQRILDIRPQAVACDLHPDYLSTRYAAEWKHLPLVGVQHHHAHIVSCMAENHVTGPVIGLALDGTGYGTDGRIWGGEVLVAEYGRFLRAAHLEYVPMPGSAAAVRQPWRMAVSYLGHAFGERLPPAGMPFMEAVGADKIEVVARMAARQFNAPLTSSLGRLFDGVAAMLGLRYTVGFEGQAAMELEMCAQGDPGECYPFSWTDKQPHRIVLGPLIRAIVADLENGVPPPVISARFHETLIRLFTDLCGVLREQTGRNQVALSGGVFQNSILLQGMSQALAKKAFSVYSHTRVPTNDGGISLGQAVAAAAQMP